MPTSSENAASIPLACRCPQREYPHDLSVHTALKSESYNPQLRSRWPWSLLKSPNLELSADHPGGFDAVR